MKFTEVVHVKLTSRQKRLIETISKSYGKSQSETVRDIIDFFVLMTETNMNLRDVLVAATPTLTEKLIEQQPEVAKAILHVSQNPEN